MIFKLFAPLLHDADGGHGGSIAKRAERAAQHVTGKLRDIVDIWAEAVFRLTDADLRRMTRLIDAQERRATLHSARVAAE